MAVLTKDDDHLATPKPKAESKANGQSSSRVDENGLVGGDSPVSSPDTVDHGTGMEERTVSSNPRERQTLKDRAKIPPSFGASVAVIFLLQICGRVFRMDTVFALLSSFETSVVTVHNMLAYVRDLCQSLAAGESVESMEYVYAFAWILVLGSIFYVLVWAPLRSGMWTGKRAKRHSLHRYMGLIFLMQYTLAWVEYLTNYERGYRNSFLPHTVALNGILQAWSAYFSFRVLPELDDAGYYSDKAVLSRSFVHENAFFQLMVVYGSLYYNDAVRISLRASILGRIIEYIFIFWPYILIRPLFPITRFKNAGTSMAGRTKKNHMFYAISTKMIKIFYLWAKYFLGFYMNFLVFLNIASDDNMKVIRGLYLLNCGTVSIAIFLHTLRFKKVLPPRLTFSLYILQIYATFSAIPYAYDLFASHRQLCGLTFVGIFCNMTRNRKIHAVWCGCVMYLLAFSDLEW